MLKSYRSSSCFSRIWRGHQWCDVSLKIFMDFMKQYENAPSQRLACFWFCLGMSLSQEILSLAPVSTVKNGILPPHDFSAQTGLIMTKNLFYVILSLKHKFCLDLCNFLWGLYEEPYGMHAKLQQRSKDFTSDRACSSRDISHDPETINNNVHEVFDSAIKEMEGKVARSMKIKQSIIQAKRRRQLTNGPTPSCSAHSGSEHRGQSSPAWTNNEGV